MLPRLEASEEIQALAMPREALPRIREVRQTTCTCGIVTVETLDVWTGPTWCPPAVGDLGQSDCPEPELNPWIRFTFPDGVPTAGIAAGASYEVSHLQASIAHPFMHHGGYDVAGEVDDEAGVPIVSWDLLSGGWCDLTLAGVGPVSGGEATCEHDLLYQSNQQWLDWLTDKP